MIFLKKLYNCLLLILVFLIPSGLYSLQGIVISLLFINWLLLKRYKKINKIPLGNLLLIAFFILLALNNLIFYSINSLSTIIKYISFLILPLSLAGYELKIKKHKTLQITFILSALTFILIADIYCIIDIIVTEKTKVFISPNILNKYSYYGLTRVFNNWHPTYVSLFLNISLILLFDIYSKKKYDFKFIFSVLVIVINIFLLNSLIGIISMFVFPTMTLKIPKNKLIIISASGVLFLTLLFVINPLKFEKIDKIKKTEVKITDIEEETNSLTIRLVKWKTALEVFRENPCFGVGISNVKDKMVLKYLENEYFNCAKYRYSPHNQYLFFAVAMGFSGLIFYLALLVVGYLKSKRLTEKLIFMLLLFFCLTEEILSRQQGIVFFATFYSLINIISKKDSKQLHEQ